MYNLLLPKLLIVSVGADKNNNWRKSTTLSIDDNFTQFKYTHTLQLCTMPDVSTEVENWDAYTWNVPI